MKKRLTFLMALFSVVALFAQPNIPSGYQSMYDVLGEAERAPIAIDAKANRQILGAAQGWGESLDFDFTAYQTLAMKLTYDTLDAGKQVALRFSTNKVVTLLQITLPENDSTLIFKLNLPDYADNDGNVKFGGIIFYNGATHWSFSYTGEPANKACTIEYIAVKEKIKLPEGYVSIYSIKPEEEKAPLLVNAVTAYQFLGNAQGWGESLAYDFSNFQSLAIKMTFDPADAGKELAVRFSVNGSAKKVIITLPTEGTSHTEEINLADYANEEGKVLVGGIVFYNGATHWSFSYTNPATQATKVEYLALKTIPAVGLVIEAVEPDLATALPLEVSTKFKAVFSPVNATNQSVTWSSGDENLATVDDDGVVTAKKIPGNVVISAVSKENESLTANFTVKIVGAATAVTGVKINDKEVNLKIGFETTLAYEIQPAGASIKSVTWSSSDTLVASVDENGIISSISVGAATITVTTKDGGFTDICTVNVIGYKEIPVGYASLYTLNFQEETTVKGMDTLSSFPAAPVPGMFNTNKDIQTGSVLGTQYNWNKYNKYCDVSPYSELVVAATFKKEDIGKKFKFRYAFSTSSADVNGGSVITNREVTIDQEEMQFIIDLENDTTDVEDLKHLGAIKFQTISEELWFVVDYVALKKSNLSGEARLSSIQLEGMGLFGFDPNNYSYTFGVKIAKLNITATPMDANARVEITNNGIINLNNKKPTEVKITVTAENGTVLIYTLNITTSAETSVNNIDELGMKVYPSYSNGKFNIEMEKVPGTVSVFDLKGNCILQKDVINVNDEIMLKTGIYIVRLQSSGVIKTAKVICSH